ncbi:MAG: peptide ABC transporter substrate-binding protein [Clostridiales bacterium]|nr:peptide ABC transporter substrate-binding protein [Clostridiales bacterium]
MARKLISIILILIFVTSVFTACREKDRTGKQFAVPVVSLPQTFDPQIASSVSEKQIALNCFDMLFRLDKNGEVKNNACESYEVSSDGLTYVFKIRKDLKYYVSDKVKSFLEEKEEKADFSCNANDYAFGITRAVLPETEAPDFDLLRNIKNAVAVHEGQMSYNKLGIEAVDDYTLKIVLEKKDDAFIYALSQAVSAPCNKEFFEATAGRYGLDRKYIISNGLFQISYIADESYTKISKNEEYAGSLRAIPSSVVFYLNTDESSVLAKLKKGTYDIAFTDSNSATELGKDETREYFENITYAMVFNMNREKLQNDKLRLGLTGCIDRANLSDKAADALIAPYYKVNGKAFEINKAKTIGYNIKTARENMVAAYAELEITSMSVDILCTEKTQTIAKSIVSNWQKNIGVELNGTVIVSDDLEKAVTSGEYDIVIYPISVDSDRAADFLSVFSSNSQDNCFGLKSNEYDRIFAGMNEKTDMNTVSKAQNYLVQNAIVIPLYYDSTCFVLAKNVEGIYFVGNRSNVYYAEGMKS